MALFTTPSGAVVDADKGTLVAPAPVSPSQQAQAAATGNAPQGTPVPQATPTTPQTPTAPQAQAAVPTQQTPEQVTAASSAAGQTPATPSAASQPAPSYTPPIEHPSPLPPKVAPVQSATPGKDAAVTSPVQLNPTGSGITTNPTGPVTTPSGAQVNPATGDVTQAPPDPYANLNPVQKQVQMYQDTYNSLGLGTIKSQYDDFEKQYGDLTKELSDAINDKNNNPWLSSTSRTEDIQKIQDRYDVKLKNLTNLLTLTDTMYKSGQAQVENIVSGANADIKATNDLAQKQLDAANALAKDNVVQSVGGRELLINKETGKTVADLGASTEKYQVVKGSTDAFGNQLPDRIFDAASGQFVGGGNSGSAPVTSNPTTGGFGGGNNVSAPTNVTSPIQNNGSTGKNGLSFAQYGLLAKTDFKPSNLVDSLSQKYLDQYIKNGSVPTASSLGRNMKPEAMAQVDARARDLYFQATGNPLPTPQIIKGYQNIILNNNKILNNLNVQENTISKNFKLAVDNIDKNGINQSAPAINQYINFIQNTMFGDPATAQYLTQNGTIQNEMASLLALRNASGTTVGDKLASAGLVPQNASEDQLKSILKIILQEAENGGDSIRQASGELYAQTDPFLQDPNNPLRQEYLSGKTSDGRVAGTAVVSKGSLNDKDFVDQALKAQGLKYDDVVAQAQKNAPTGTVPALDNSTGQTVFVTTSEFQSGGYTPL